MIFVKEPNFVVNVVQSLPYYVLNAIMILNEKTL